MTSTGYLGGDVSMAERHKLRDRYITPLVGVDLTLRNQCRCGLTTYAKWRGRWYCKGCARWIAEPLPSTPNPSETRHDDC